MALPKRRKSRARVRTRRAHWKAEAVTKTGCPQCEATIVPHRACGKCGYYNGRQVMASQASNLPDNEE